MSEQQSSVVYLHNVRLSFPHIAEPQKQQNDGGEARISYNAEFIMAPEHPGFAKFFEVVNRMAVEKWNQHAAGALQMIQADRKKRCYGWGQEKLNGRTFQPYDGYPGNMFITAGRNTMPQIIDENGNPVDPANTMQCQAIARKMYGGCWVNAAVKPWLQDNKHGKGVRCDFVAIQFLRDDKPFGEAVVDASSMFGAAPQAAAPQAAAPAAGVPGFAPTAPAMPGAPFPAAGVPTMPAAPAGGPFAPPSWAPPTVPAPGAVPSFLQ